MGPATRGSCSSPRRWFPSLNEGRPGGAGNPRGRGRGQVRPRVAQRRPARWGRQPSSCPCRTRRSPRPLNEGRPGGAGNPSTYDDITLRALNAQRRPARWGRQPHRDGARPAPAGDRSTKAGPVGPATPPPRPVAPRQHLLRSTKAGPVGPATPAGGRRRRRGRLALNEGRPGGAGNPRAVGPRLVLAAVRSTKAGPVGPATLGNNTLKMPKVTAAQRRPARWGRQPW